MDILTKIKEKCMSNKYNGAVFIANNEQVLLHDYFGYKNIEDKKPFEINNKFRIGSITKQFTACAILLLVQKGLCKLSDAIGKYIKDTPYTEEVTIHHLLSNSSGIPNFPIDENYDDYLNKSNFHELMIKHVVFKQDLHFKPGSQFEYSSSGYLLLTYIIEQISGMNYENFLKEKIFIPLQMYQSGFCHKEQQDPAFVSLYDVKDDHIVEAQKIDMKIASGGGGLYSSIGDLYIWQKGLLKHLVLNEALTEKMFSIQTPITKTGGYGYGVIVDTLTNRDQSFEMIYHPGNGPGVFAQNNIINRKYHLIMLSNINDKNRFRKTYNEILDLIINEL